ncbi:MULTISPECIES: anhydro-N-acetylmuramic acid kinase [unclassified Moraxella]|uniref:anhydro-N-acetylmuramic acid kinase n=1 Tax=unclassified Moraxella TaxID=2685852 RepID=UPI003AF7B7B0
MFDEGFFSHFTEIMDDMASKHNPLADSPYVIGMMSGTSLDGLDAVLCQFYEIDEDNDEPVEILATVSEPFPADLREALLALTAPNGVADFIQRHNLAFQSELDVFGWASVAYAEFASQLVLKLMNQAQVTPDEVMAIGCHGQTVRHRPEWAFSLQLLDPNVLAERTGVAVVSDFRRRDMAVGGQGAPLVPTFHHAMFGQTSLAKADKSTVILNLGGIANVTVLNGLDNVVGFDTGVANLLLDAWCERHTGQAFDKNGDWAKTGQVIEPLLSLLLAHPYFALPAPKSTGREDFNLTWLDEKLHELNHAFPNLAYSPADVQATLTELTAVSVTDAIQSVNNGESGELFVCGGGAYNGYLMERLQALLPSWTVKSTEDIGLSPRWVEAVAFGWLAQQTITNQPSNLPSVTGASKAVVLGQVCF